MSENHWRGIVSVFVGSSSGPKTTPEWSILGTTKLQQLGASLAGVGDTNGDGFCDLFVGSINEDSTPRFGTASLYLGGPLVLNSAGMQIYGTWGQVLTLRSGTTTILQPWNKAPSKAFDVRLKSVRSASGRGAIKLWIDARTVGSAFGAGSSASPWTATTTTPVDLLGSRSGLAAAKSYHFRVRVLGDPAVGFVPSASRWIYGSSLGDPQGTQFRTP
jgi:hypothetical protein